MDARNDIKYNNSGLKTTRQWNKERKTIKEGSSGIKLYYNGYREKSGMYYYPSEVRDMTEEEWREYRKPLNEKAKNAKLKRDKRAYIEGYEENGLRLREEFIKQANMLPVIPCDNPSGVIIIDTETTGLSYFYDEIIQISIMDGDQNVLMNEYVQPYFKKEWPDAQKVNGIPPEMCKGKPFAHDLIPKVKGIFESADLIVGYNQVFDMGMLEAWGINYPDKEQADVMRMFAPIYGEWNSHFEDYKWQKLTTCAAYYGYEFKAHDSMEDVRATWHCYKQIMEHGKHRTLADILEQMNDLDPSKIALIELRDMGGLIYYSCPYIFHNKGEMENAWQNDEKLREEYGTFRNYAIKSAEEALKTLGMSEEEIRIELKNWDFYDIEDQIYTGVRQELSEIKHAKCMHEAGAKLNDSEPKMYL